MNGDFDRLYDAALKGDWELVRLLIDNGADPNHPTGDGFTPLMFAAASGDLATVRVLLDRGADPGLRTQQDLAADWSLNQAVFDLLKQSSEQP